MIALLGQLKPRLVLPIAALVAVFLLSACGDDAEESPTPSPQAQVQAPAAIASETTAPASRRSIELLRKVLCVLVTPFSSAC